MNGGHLPKKKYSNEKENKYKVTDKRIDTERMKSVNQSFVPDYTCV